MVNAQKWLESQEKYNTKEKRSKVIELDISSQGLEGELDLSDFTELEKLFCSWNKLTDLQLSAEKLFWVEANNNNLKDLSIFSKHVHLKKIDISNNDFAGSLKPLENLVELSQLNINKTNIDSGLKYLPDSINNFWSSGPLVEKEKLEINEINDHGWIKKFSQKLKEYKKKQEHQIQVLPEK
jgi:hypothetical protein